MQEADTGISEFRRAWPLLLACLIGVGLGTTGLVFYTFGQVVRPLATEFHWGRGAISGGMLAFSIGTVLISPSSAISSTAPVSGPWRCWGRQGSRWGCSWSPARNNP